MFESLKKKLQSALHSISGNSRITRGNISEAVKNIRRILYQSDVNFKIAKEITEKIEEEAIGTEVHVSLNPEQVFTKIVNDNLIQLMSCGNHNLILSDKTIILLIGLQGAGKTTFAHKLAKYVKDKFNKKPLLVACDIYRPAAIEQLEILAKDNGLDIFKEEKEKNVNKIIKDSIDFSTKNDNNLLIVDTAGRQTVDKDMMSELKNITDNFKITESLLVLDGMIGQTSVEIAKSFNEIVNITGVVLTKMDGDSNGGVALSIAKSINKPIKLISIGEKINDIEEFHPDRIANKILGKGDIVTLVEKIENESKRLKDDSSYTSKLNYIKLKEYIESLENIGGTKRVIEMLPLNDNIDENAIESNSTHIKKTKYIIDSMTPNERKCFSKLDLSRKKRIARGSGTKVEDVNKTIKLFERISDVQSKLKGKNMFQIINDLKNGKL